MNHIHITMLFAFIGVWAFVLGTKWVKADKFNRRRGYQAKPNKNFKLLLELALLVAAVSFVWGLGD